MRVMHPTKSLVVVDRIYAPGQPMEEWAGWREAGCIPVDPRDRQVEEEIEAFQPDPPAAPEVKPRQGAYDKRRSKKG